MWPHHCVWTAIFEINHTSSVISEPLSWSDGAWRDELFCFCIWSHKEGSIHHACCGEVCREDCLAGTVHMEICSHFFLCASPFTNGNDCFVASFRDISLPWDVKLALGEIPPWLGLKSGLCGSTRKGEQGGSRSLVTLGVQVKGSGWQRRFDLCHYISR